MDDRRWDRAVRSTFTVVREWTEEGDESGWPPPDEHVESRIDGPLADRVRAKLGGAPEDPVLVIETVETGGSSEWTEEHYFTFEVRCGSRTWGTEHWSDTSPGNGLRRFIEWVNEPSTTQGGGMGSILG